MGPKKTILKAAALYVLGAIPACAADASGNFAIRGVGAQSCGAVVAAIKEADDATRANIVQTLSVWLGGYMTYANRTIEGRFDATPFVSDVDMLAIVVDRCEAVPDAQFETAVQEIVSILAPFGPAEISEVAPLDGSVALRVSTVVALQEALIDLGLLKGKADGTMGPMTRAAIARFNSDRGLGSGDAISIETILKVFGEG